MEKQDVSKILSRVKANYPEFIVDDYKIDEWFKELKNYDLADVMEKLEQHMRSEQYGRRPPMIYFLTNYLVTSKEKSNKQDYYVRCQICRKTVGLNDYDSHYGKCNSIEYIARQYKRFKNQTVNKDVLLTYDDDKFNKLYNEVLKLVYQSTDDKEEKEKVGKILDE